VSFLPGPTHAKKKEKNMKKVIKVTETDIRLGSKTIMSGTTCILARAAKRAGLKNVYSGFSYLIFGSKDNNMMTVNYPKIARDTQRYFMGTDREGPKPKPFSFTITY